MKVNIPMDAGMCDYHNIINKISDSDVKDHTYGKMMDLEVVEINENTVMVNPSPFK